MTLQRMGLPSETDRLFGRLERGVFRDDSPSSVIEERKSILTIPGGVADDVYITPSVVTAIQGGAYNGTFTSGTDDDSSVIDNTENPLPGWKIVHSVNSSFKFQRIATSLAVHGYAIEITALSGVSVGDRSYIETIIPVGLHQQYLNPTVWTPVHTAALRIAFEYDLLGYDLTTAAGGTVSGTCPSTQHKPLRHFLVPDRNAVYLRARIGAEAFAGVVSGSSLQLYGFTAEPIPLHYATLYAGRTAALAGTGTNALPCPVPISGLTNGQFYVAHRSGLVLSVSGLVDGRTGGTLDFGVRNSTQSLTYTTVARINASNPTSRRASVAMHGLLQHPAAYGDTLAQFDAGDQLRMTAETSSYTPTSDTCLASAELAMWNPRFDVTSTSGSAPAEG